MSSSFLIPRIECSVYMLAVTVSLPSQSFFNIIPVKTLTKPVFSPQGLHYSNDRWGLFQIHTQALALISLTLSPTATQVTFYCFQAEFIGFI